MARMFSLVAVYVALMGMMLAGGKNAGASSVWDSAKGEAYSIVGKIQQVSEDQNSVEVTIVGNNRELQHLSVCRSHVGGDIHNKVELALVQSLKTAATEKQRVSVHYDGPFQKCISSLSVLN